MFLECGLILCLNGCQAEILAAKYCYLGVFLLKFA